MINLELGQHLVKNLKLDSEVLDIIHSDFMRLLPEGRFWIHTFQERRPMNNMIGKIVEDFSSKIDWQPQRYETLDGNHRNMIQFVSAQEHSYRRIVSAFKFYMARLDIRHDEERECGYAQMLFKWHSLNQHEQLSQARTR